MELKGIEKLEEIVNIINEAENIVIISHEDPDGDAIGSSLALYNYLQEYFQNKDVFKPIQIVLRKVSGRFVILKGYDDIKENVEGDIDLLIVLDLNEKHRLGELAYTADIAKKVLIIDHHIGEPNFGDYKIFDKNVAATALLLSIIYDEIKKEVDLPEPSKEVVEAALAGVISDTSGFKNTNTDKDVLEFVVKTMGYGINVNDMFLKVLINKSKNELALNSLVLNRLEYFHNDRIATSYLLLSDEAYRNRDHGEHEGFSDILRDIQGVDVGILIRETEEGFKISIRSEKDTDCRIIAEAFGGGGHKNAAGVTFKNKDLEKIKKDIVEKTAETLEQ